MIIFVIFSLLAVPIISLEEISCEVPTFFTINLRSKHKVDIFDGKLSIKFARDKVVVYTYQETSDVNFLINEAIVIFQGGMVVDDLFDQTKIINQSLHPRTIGMAVLQNISCFDTILTQCQIFLQRNKSDSTNLPYEVENNILHLAASCMDVELNVKIGSLLHKDFSNSTDFYDFGPLSVNPQHGSSNSCSELEHPISEENMKMISIQSTLNTILDAAVIEVGKILKRKGLGVIKIPDIFKPYAMFPNSIIKVSGYFNAKNGYFKDFSTLKRTSDVVFDRSKQKLSVTFGLGLGTAQADYGYYKAKYSIASISGSVSTSFKNVAFDMKVSVDYEEKPCKVKLEFFHFTRFDQFIVNVTGAGILNPLANTLATWVMNDRKTTISELLERMISQFLASELGKQNCETYRPALKQKCNLN